MNALLVIYGIVIGVLVFPFAYLAYALASSVFQRPPKGILADAAVFSVEFMIVFVSTQVISQELFGTPKSLLSSIFVTVLAFSVMVSAMLAIDMIADVLRGSRTKKFWPFYMACTAALLTLFLTETFVVFAYYVEDKGLDTQLSQQLGRIGSTANPHVGLASHLGYYLLRPTRGSVITVKTERVSGVPADWQQPVSSQFHLKGSASTRAQEEVSFYVSRVVGLPGEDVVLDHGRISVNGVLLWEPYVRNEMAGGTALSVRLGPTDYLLAEDVRKDSYSSTGIFPCLIVNEQQIQSRQFFIVWPISSFGFVQPPLYNIPNPSIWRARINQKWIERLAKM